MDDKQRNFKFNMLISILIVILIIAAVAQVTILKYSVNNLSDESMAETQDAQNFVEEPLEILKNELSIESESVKKLYSYIEKFNYYGELLVYQNNKVDLSNITNQLILLTVFENIDESEAKQELTYIDEYDHEHFFYPKELIESKAIQIFGPDVKINHENASPWDGTACLYKNEMYEYFEYEGGGGVPWENSKNELVKAEQDENNIYIYDKYLHIVEIDHIINKINYAGYYDVYEGTDRKVKLLDNINFENAGFYDDKYNELSQIKVIENYLGKEIPLYKHTFKKAEDGSYYWYSTESI